MICFQNVETVIRCTILLFTTLALVCECTRKCLSCTDLKEGEQCQHIVTCPDNEVCFLEKYTTSNGETRYDGGCADHKMCPAQDLQNTFGKRTSDHSHILCHRCCNNTHICNTDLTCDNLNNIPRECEDIQSNSSGDYTIYPSSQNHPVHVYCIMEKGKKWTVIQRRINGSVDFFRTWKEYKEGFGSAYGEYWLGNSQIHDMSTYGSHELSIVLVNSTGEKAYANYSKFSVEDEESNYLLHVTGYSGTSRYDAMNSGGKPNPAGGGDMQMFTTKDRDNDKYNGTNCAVRNHGGWWYGMCRHLGINEVYRQGNLFSQFFPSTVSSIMMIRRT
ncbi:microfibril-associated glycoprotein 4-like isoform X1 [Mytilus galloprovincialis]|uniref:microfibril-associated glycoprotein 4-like isoform X1 n=1 Tax=Mytilus galloprovincialis TaxID=29158 RepID=UPI003F7CB6F2